MSAGAGGGGGAGAQRCYYEVLEVDLKADEDAIKKAFRKAALLWHPDKNMHRVAEATERMQQIQAAYACLSDPTERAWYDSHREAILGAEDVDENLLSIFALFSSRAFGAMDDSATGFFSVYHKAFETIAGEEKKYASDEFEGAADTPPFGTSTTAASAVLKFYRYWSNYSSRMHFGWADEHTPSDAPNRFVRRAIEKENRVLRQKARKERTESIRALVDFVKRRDWRYVAATVEVKRKAEEEAERARVAAAERARATAVDRARLAAAAEAEAEAYEAEVEASGAYRIDVHGSDEHGGKPRKRGQKRRAGDAGDAPVVVRAGLPAAAGDGASSAVSEAAADATVVGRTAAASSRDAAPHSRHRAADEPAAEDAGSRSSDEDGVAVFVCELCNKVFRSAAAMDNHERSKKHIAAVSIAAALAASLEKNDGSSSSTDSDDEADRSGGEPSSSTASGSSKVHDDTAGSREGEGSAGVDDDAGSFGTARSSDDEEEKSDAADADDEVFAKLAALRVRGGGGGAAAATAGSDSSALPGGWRGELMGRQTVAGAAAGESDDDDDGAPVADAGAAAVKAKGKGRRRAKGSVSVAAPPAPKTVAVANAGAGGGGDSGVTEAPAFSIKLAPAFLSGGSKGVPQRAKANAAGVAAQLRLAGSAGATDAAAAGGRCDVCGEVFKTRNILFAHIRNTGHAAPPPAAASPAATSARGATAAAGSTRAAAGGGTGRSAQKRAAAAAAAAAPPLAAVDSEEESGRGRKKGRGKK